MTWCSRVVHQMSGGVAGSLILTEFCHWNPEQAPKDWVWKTTFPVGSCTVLILFLNLQFVAEIII